MNLADLAIIFILVFMIYRGSRIGFIREIFATSSFILSIFIGALIIPVIIKHVSNASNRSIWAISLMIIFILTFLTIGELIGDIVRKKFVTKKLDKPDRILGGALRFLGTLVVIWLAASILIQIPNKALKSQVQQSLVIGQINKSLPSTPSFMSTIGNIIAPNGFPMVFIGNEPLANKHIALNASDALNKSVNRAQTSVVKIEGLGCGGIVEGSGFIAANNLVITNAHVVAGIRAPFIYDQNGQHKSSVVYFDPNLDVAILSSSNLSGSPLAINTGNVEDYTLGAVMGYPGGKDLVAKTAATLNKLHATGKNIYNQGDTLRDIYVIQADIQPGNSGGPFIDSNGQVDGLIFAKSTSYQNQGYALSMGPVKTALNSAIANPTQVNTGQCAE